MRFAIATLDPYLGVFEAFVAAGWKPIRLFTVPLNNPFDTNDAVIALAAQHQARVQLSRITTRDFEELHDEGCEALIVASYNWKIGDWRPYLKAAVNFHASPLPEARGPYPLVRAIMERRQTWAVTCHQLTQELDAGDILAAENFPMQPDETHESLRLKVQLASKRLASRVADQLPELWMNATPQGEGSYWKRWDNWDRLIDFSLSVSDILCHLRAFGLMESLVWVNDNTVISVRRAVGWTEIHTYKPGHIVSNLGKTVIIATPDGYIALLEWQFATPDIAAEIKTKLSSRALQTS